MLLIRDGKWVHFLALGHCISVKTVTPVLTAFFELRAPSLGRLLLRLAPDRDAFRSLWFAVVAENAVGWEGLTTAEVKGGFNERENTNDVVATLKLIVFHLFIIVISFATRQCAA